MLIYFVRINDLFKDLCSIRVVIPLVAAKLFHRLPVIYSGQQD